MSIQVPTLREELQLYREQNYEQQLSIDKLVEERDDAMDGVEKHASEFEKTIQERDKWRDCYDTAMGDVMEAAARVVYWQDRAVYWERKYNDLYNICECEHEV